MELRNSQRGLQGRGIRHCLDYLFPGPGCLLTSESNYCLPARCPSQLYFASFTAR
jgi:hypothetical protein